MTTRNKLTNLAGSPDWFNHNPQWILTDPDATGYILGKSARGRTGALRSTRIFTENVRIFSSPM